MIIIIRALSLEKKGQKRPQKEKGQIKKEGPEKRKKGDNVTILFHTYASK